MTTQNTTNVPEFESGDEAIEYAHEQMQDTPVDEMDAAEITAELTMLKEVLEWEKPRHNQDISYRKQELEAAQEYDHFDTLQNDRQGNRYIHPSNGALVVIDGANMVEGNLITHYHYIMISESSGEVDRPLEAKETWPDEEDTHWITVEELDESINDGVLRPAVTVPADEVSGGSN